MMSAHQENTTAAKMLCVTTTRDRTTVNIKLDILDLDGLAIVKLICEDCFVD